MSTRDNGILGSGGFLKVIESSSLSGSIVIIHNILNNNNDGDDDSKVLDLL